MRSKTVFVCLAILGLLVAGNAYGGPVLCDGTLSDTTAKATGKLLVTFGFYYSALGFAEAGEQEKIAALEELIRPAATAREAENLFSAFVKTRLPVNLKKLDALVRKTKYTQLYKELLENGRFVPVGVWSDVSSRAQKQGLSGLMDI